MRRVPSHGRLVILSLVFALPAACDGGAKPGGTVMPGADLASDRGEGEASAPHPLASRTSDAPAASPSAPEPPLVGRRLRAEAPGELRFAAERAAAWVLARPVRADPATPAQRRRLAEEGLCAAILAAGEAPVDGAPESAAGSSPGQAWSDAEGSAPAGRWRERAAEVRRVLCARLDVLADDDPLLAAECDVWIAACRLRRLPADAGRDARPARARTAAALRAALEHDDDATRYFRPYLLPMAAFAGLATPAEARAAVTALGLSAFCARLAAGSYAAHRDDLYLLTHVVFAATDYGLSARPLLTAEEASALRGVFARFLPAAQRLQEYDLLLEMALAARLLGDALNAAQPVLADLLRRQEASGAFADRSREFSRRVADAGRDAEDWRWHPTLLFLQLAAR